MKHSDRSFRLPTWASFAAILLAAPLLLWIEYGKPMTDDAVLLPMMRMALSRLIASAVFTVILLSQGYHILNPLRKPFGRSLLWCLPAFAVAVNNMPILALITGQVRILHGEPVYWGWFALECFAIGLFEEITFRGVVLLRFAESRRDTHRGLLVSIFLSSAVFAAMHLVNLFVGAGPGAVRLQIGYSFLIGAMCAVGLFKTANLWLCVALHAIYDFGGRMIESLGAGRLWDTPTVVFTAVLAVATTVYMVLLFARMKPRETDRIYFE